MTDEPPSLSRRRLLQLAVASAASPRIPGSLGRLAVPLPPPASAEALTAGWSNAMYEAAQQFNATWDAFRKSSRLRIPSILSLPNTEMDEVVSLKESLVPLMQNLRRIIALRDEVFSGSPEQVAVRTAALEEVIRAKKKFYLESIRKYYGLEDDYTEEQISYYKGMMEHCSVSVLRDKHDHLKDTRAGLSAEQLEEQKHALDAKIDNLARQAGLPRSAVDILTERLDWLGSMEIGTLVRPELLSVITHSKILDNLAWTVAFETENNLFNARLRKRIPLEDVSHMARREESIIQAAYREAFQEVFGREPDFLPKMRYSIGGEREGQRQHSVQSDPTPHERVPDVDGHSAVGKTVLRAAVNAAGRLMEERIPLSLSLAEREKPASEPAVQITVIQRESQPLALPHPQPDIGLPDLSQPIPYRHADQIEIRREQEGQTQLGK